MAKKTATLEKDLTFEAALDELETITRRLEDGKDSLEESMQLYERGILLKTFCEKQLKAAEGKWKVLKKSGSDVSAEEIDSDTIPEQGDLNDLQESMF